jgi:hypothetical protein
MQGDASAPRFGLMVLGGLGYMGWGPFNTPKRSEKPPPDTIIDMIRESGGWLIGIADFKVRENPPWLIDVKEWLQAQAGKPIPVVATITELIDYFEAECNARGLLKSFPIIVYDATPPKEHIKNFQTLSMLNCYYLGEKPLVVNDDGLKALRQLPETAKIFCDFIEMVNPVVIAAQDYLREHGCQITGLKFWRAGASGLKHAIWGDRAGVQGGALLDKAAHDFSIITALLGPDNLLDFQDGDVRAQVEHLVLAHQRVYPTIPGAPRSIYPNRWAFLDGRSIPILRPDPKADRDNPPADGVTKVDIGWRLAPHVPVAAERAGINAECLFSWLGYTGWRDDKEATAAEGLFVRDLKKLHLARHEWLFPGHEGAAKGPALESHPPHYEHMDTTYATHECEEKQVRIGIIHCTDRTLVCNFYSHNGYRALHVVPNDPAPRAPVRSTFHFREGDNHSARKHKEICDMLQRVIDYACNPTPANEPRNIGIRAAVLVHDALIRARNDALAYLSNPNFDADGWRARSRPVHDRAIKAVGTQ